MQSTENQEEFGPVAPRTPETDKVYNCLNEVNSSHKLAYEIALNAYNKQKADYEAQMGSKQAVLDELETERSKITQVKGDLDFYTFQKEQATAKLPGLEHRFTIANDQVLECNVDENQCTVAQKEIRAKIANEAAEKIQDLLREIQRYTTKIAELTASHDNLVGTFATYEASQQPKINAETDAVTAARDKYLEAKDAMTDAQKEFLALDGECMVAAFHDNSEKLELQRDMLLKRYGLKVILPDEFGEIPVDVPDVYDPSTWDCRYKQVEACQGNNFSKLSENGRQACRQVVTAECFEEKYESDWELDFWSFLLFFFAIPLCIFEDGFDYGLCVEKSAYILNLTYLQDHLGIAY